MSFIGIVAFLSLALVFLGILAFLYLPLAMRLSVSRPIIARFGSTKATQVEVAIKPFGAAMPWIPIPKGRKIIADRRKRQAFSRTQAERPKFANMRHAAQEIRNLAGHGNISHVLGHAVIGLNDPADTGRLMGLLYATQASLSEKQRSAFRVDFDFSGAKFAGDLQMIASFRPIWLLPSALRIAMPATRKD